jgi:hypothetical protein
MNNSFGDDNTRSMPSDAEENQQPDEVNWVDDDTNLESPSPSNSVSEPVKKPTLKNSQTLIMVETAFLASAASLIWLINY